MPHSSCGVDIGGTGATGSVPVVRSLSQMDLGHTQTSPELCRKQPAGVVACSPVLHY